MSTPEKVEPGQVWKDRDERSKGAGEFTVEQVMEEIEGPNRGAFYAVVYRHATAGMSSIRVDRLLAGKAYRYIGRQR